MARFWFKLDSAFTEHKKFLFVGPNASYLHIAAIAWCSRNMTDGLIPHGQVDRLVNWTGVSEYNPARETEDYVAAYRIFPYALAERLVAVGLWEDAEDGYQVHDYLEWQRSAEEWEQLSQQRSENGSRGGKASGVARQPKQTKQKRSKAEANAKQNGSKPRSNHEANAKQIKEVDKELTPPYPPLGGNGTDTSVPPERPKSKRQRDIDAYDAAMTNWAAQHFPDADPRAVNGLVSFLSGGNRRRPLTVDEIRRYAQKHPQWGITDPDEVEAQ